MKCMETYFGGCGLSSFGVMAPFCLPSKMAKSSPRTMDYSPWSSKNLIDRNWLKKIMQIGVDVTYMHTNFGVCVTSPVSEIPLLSKTFIFLFRSMDYSPWSSKNLINRN